MSEDSIRNISEEVVCTVDDQKSTSNLQDKVFQRLGFHGNKEQCVLIITTVGFSLFVIAEIIGALTSGSLSLLGDAAAMSVDVCTYICGIWAESVKSKGQRLSQFSLVMTELVIPVFSLCALLGVTGYITAGAITVIMLDDKSAKSVNVNFLYAYASVNLMVDIVSAGSFCRSRNVFYQRETDTVAEADIMLNVGNHDDDGIELQNVNSIQGDNDDMKKQLSSSSDDLMSAIMDENLPINFESNSQEINLDAEVAMSAQNLSSPNTPHCPSCDNYNLEVDDCPTVVVNSSNRININMASAFVHVGADTLRTFAIFIAAVVSTATDVRGNICDAWAAVIVMMTIVLMAIPLIKEIIVAAKHLRLRIARNGNVEEEA